MKKNVEPDDSISDGLELISSDPPAYKTEHYIIEADKKYISKAVAWAKCIESNVYPTMLEMMGHTPTVNLHALHFVNHRLRGDTGTGAWFEKIRRFRNTYYKGSRIKIFNGKLHDQPPYRLEGDITHETIHGLLHEVKHSRNRTEIWAPIRQSEGHLLEGIFEMELSRRLGNEAKSKERYLERIKKGRIHAVFAKFWKAYGWKPFKSLIVRLHEDSNFPQTKFDQNNFAYHMSLYAEEDVSRFFEKCGWYVDNKTKEKITEDLQQKE